MVAAHLEVPEVPAWPRFGRIARSGREFQKFDYFRVEAQRRCFLATSTVEREHAWNRQWLF